MISAIILAAGRSKRMGAQKLLLPFGGGTVIGRVAGEILRSPVGRIFIVVGADDARVVATVENELALRSAGRARKFFSSLTNPDPASDMLSSVRCGLRALPQDCDAILVALGDQPSISGDLVAGMIGAFRGSGRGIVVPVYGGKRGHPLLFAVQYREEILNRYDDLGLRGLLRAHPKEVFELPADSAGVLSDMDYPEDYRRELGRLQRRGP
jgi:molybdenum cofactor cytidylyltransferase